MYPEIPHLRFLALFIIGTLCGSCGTAKEVRILAEKSGGNVAHVSVALSKLTKADQEIGARRIERLSRFSFVIAESRSVLESELRAREAAGDSTFHRLFKEVQKESKRSTSAYNDLLMNDRERRLKYQQAVTKLSVPAKQLNKTSRHLLDLSKEDSFKGRAKKFFKFVEKFAKDLDKARDDADTSSEEAKNSIKKLDVKRLIE